MTELTVHTTAGLPQQDLSAGVSDFYSSRPWLHYQMLDDTVESLVVSVWSAPTQLVAAAPVFFSDTESNPLYRLEISGIDDPTERASRPRALVGNRRGYRGGLLLDRSHGDRHQAVELLLNSILGECHARGISDIWWPYLRTSELKALLPHTEPQVPRLLAADCSIHLQGTTFDDYLSSLPGARRREISRERRLIHASGVEIRRDPLPDFGPQLADLVYEHGRRHGSTASTEEIATVIARQELACGSVGWVSSAREGTAVHSACLAYVGAGHVTVRAFGSRERARKPSTYFELAYYQQIEQAYAVSATSVHLGIGTLRAKVLRGARVEPLWGLQLGATAPASSSALTRMNNQKWSQIGLESGDDSLLDMQPEIEEWI